MYNRICTCAPVDFYWGDTFRIAFAHLGELRSIIPTKYYVNILALTATATFRVVSTRLSLVNPVGYSPFRDNIKYVVKALPTSYGSILW